MATFVHLCTIPCSSWQYWIPSKVYSLSFFQFPPVTIDKCVPCKGHVLCTSSDWLGLGFFLHLFSLGLMIILLYICLHIEVYSSTLMMEAECSSDASPSVHKTAQFHHQNNHDLNQCTWHCSGALCCQRTKRSVLPQMSYTKQSSFQYEAWKYMQHTGTFAVCCHAESGLGQAILHIMSDRWILLRDLQCQLLTLQHHLVNNTDYRQLYK